MIEWRVFCRQVRMADGETVLEPCSPGERNAIAVTLTELAEQGKATQVTSGTHGMHQSQSLVPRQL